jgi:hypothetical protein
VTALDERAAHRAPHPAGEARNLRALLELLREPRHRIDRRRDRAVVRSAEAARWQPNQLLAAPTHRDVRALEGGAAR